MKKLYIILLILPLIGFGQGNVGYMSSYERIFKTTDSGETWTQVSGVNQENWGTMSIERISFINETTGYVGFNGGPYLWKTTDSGETWTQVTGFTDWEGVDYYNNIHSISFVNETNISTIEPLTPQSNRELIKTTNIIGQENTTIKNQPMIEIYNDGSVEKKYIVE